jgi:hypothetical protein
MERIDSPILYSKYRVNNLQINPEYYPLSRFSFASQKTIRSLVLFEDVKISPLIYTDKISNILDEVIPKDSLHKIYLDQHFHMYSGIHAQEKSLPENITATKFLRHYLFTYYGFNSFETVFGPVVLCGSFNPSTLSRDGFDYSIPYEIVEQSLRMHEAN